MGQEEEFNLTLVLILIGLLGIGAFIAVLELQKDAKHVPLSAMQKTSMHGSDLVAAAGAVLFDAPDKVIEGDTALFAWDADKNAYSECAGSTVPPGSDGGWTGAKPLNGTQSVGPILENTTYFLDCSKGDTMGRDVELVSVLPSKLTIKAYPEHVASGGQVTIVWNASHVNACVLMNSATGDVLSTELSGSASTGPVEQTTTFTLECETPLGSESESVTVSAGS